MEVSAQVKSLVKSIKCIFDILCVGLARIVAGVITVACLDMTVPLLMPLCGGALALGVVGSILVGREAVKLHKNKKVSNGLEAKELHQNRKDISDNIYDISKLTGSHIGGAVGFCIGEILLPIGGGLIGSVIGFFLGLAIGHFSAYLIEKRRSKKLLLKLK